MLAASTDIQSFTDMLAVANSIGISLGGALGAFIGRTSWSKALECLTLGATAGAVAGCFVVFLAYDGSQLLGLI